MNIVRPLDRLGASGTKPAPLKENSRYLSLEGVRHGKRRGDPTVRVDHMVGQTVDDALDGVADELISRDDQTARQQEDGGEGVVHAEDGTVRDDLVVLEKAR